MSKLKKISRDLRKIEKTEIEWGWINGKVYNKGDINGRGGVPYALVAIRNEFGGYTLRKDGKYIYIPARSYFQQSTEISKRKSVGKIEDVYDDLFQGRDTKQSLKILANEQVKAVHESVDRNNMKALHPKTAAIKGSTRQWHDTGKMMENVTAKVIYKRSDYKGD